MKIFYDVNNGDEAKIYYARYDSELFGFTHTTNIPLTEHEIDETDGNKDLCKGLRLFVHPSSIHIDDNNLEKYYFYIPTSKIRERENWIERIEDI